MVGIQEQPYPASFMHEQQQQQQQQHRMTLADALACAKSGSTSIKVQVPTSDHVAEIVGRQGYKIKELRTRTNTYIRTPQRGEEPIFTITGQPEGIEQARRKILEDSQHFTDIRANKHRSSLSSTTISSLPAGHEELFQPVKKKYVGLVIGPKGSTIKRIQQETHTFITTPARDHPCPEFKITGLRENIEKAVLAIHAHIQERTSEVASSSSPSCLTPSCHDPASQGLVQQQAGGGSGCYGDGFSQLLAAGVNGGSGAPSLPLTSSQLRTLLHAMSSSTPCSGPGGGIDLFTSSPPLLPAAQHLQQLQQQLAASSQLPYPGSNMGAGEFCTSDNIMNRYPSSNDINSPNLQGGIESWNKGMAADCNQLFASKQQHQLLSPAAAVADAFSRLLLSGSSSCDQLLQRGPGGRSSSSGDYPSPCSSGDNCFSPGLPPYPSSSSSSASGSRWSDGGVLLDVDSGISGRPASLALRHQSQTPQHFTFPSVCGPPASAQQLQQQYRANGESVIMPGVASALRNGLPQTPPAHLMPQQHQLLLASNGGRIDANQQLDAESRASQPPHHLHHQGVSMMASFRNTTAPPASLYSLQQQQQMRNVSTAAMMKSMILTSNGSSSSAYGSVSSNGGGCFASSASSGLDSCGSSSQSPTDSIGMPTAWMAGSGSSGQLCFACQRRDASFELAPCGCIACADCILRMRDVCLSCGHNAVDARSLRL